MPHCRTRFERFRRSAQGLESGSACLPSALWMRQAPPNQVRVDCSVQVDVEVLKEYFRNISFIPEPRLTSTEALRALGHTTRLRILARLQLRGDSTATECAEEVGESASSCSYHLRTLAKHGFVEEV